MNAGFVGNDEIAAVAVMENPDDSRMSAAQDPYHSSFGARRRAGGLASPSVTPLDPCDNAVSVHRVPQLVRRNEEVAIEVFSR